MTVLKGLLLDVGHTIAYPPSGNWFLPQALGSLLRAYHLPTLSPDVFSSAMGKGLEYLDANHHVLTEDQELGQFRAFFTIVLKEAGLKDAPTGLIDNLARVHVTTNDNFALYPDVIEALDHVKGLGLLMGILSDNWPSLRNRLLALGISRYFTTLAISAELGSCKPHERIYRSAIEGLGLQYHEALFVDDDEENLAAGRRLGLQCLRIHRLGSDPSTNTPCTTSMAGVVRHIEGLLRGSHNGT
jgi:HAD superfamily hydrolase (TIGR01509 family)